MEIYEEKPLGWWLGFLAMALVKVIRASTLRQARKEARTHLHAFAMRFQDLPESMRREWLNATKED